ncbi:MAG: BolA family transcriptional regulator [Wigglesworthia glossinidia]|nr:BolA family transcriptional regulator [Wigglesworthia glossinidia]
MEKVIKKKIETELSPIFFCIKNESHKHKASKNLNTHFNITVVSKKFDNTSQIQRHRIIYQILSKELLRNIYSISINTYSKIEWKNYNKNIPDTPICCNNTN